jgi:hypothetical protein
MTYLEYKLIKTVFVGKRLLGLEGWDEAELVGVEIQFRKVKIVLKMDTSDGCAIL